MKTPITLEGMHLKWTPALPDLSEPNPGERLLTVKNIRIIGIDNMNDYYHVSLKEYRLQELERGCPGRRKRIPFHPWQSGR